MTDTPEPSDVHRPPSAAEVSRRRFLGAAGGVAGVAAVGGATWAALLRERVNDAGPRPSAPTSTRFPTSAVDPPPSPLTGAAPGRVLVVVELAGGNDALNTVVPAAGVYRDARPTLAVAEADLVALSGTDLSLHPSLAPLVPHWDAGALAAVAGVGMPDQSRSHFQAMDTWWTAVPGVSTSTGWLGRWLDATGDGEPDPLRAIALGGGSPALVGIRGNATVVRSPATFGLRTSGRVDADALVDAFLATAEPLAADPVHAAAQGAIPTALNAVELLEMAAGADDAAIADGAFAANGGNTITGLLEVAAGIIDMDIGTRVITVGISGFDTHAGQPDTHAALLADVGGGIASFLDRLASDGHGDRVMVVTTSEFGRRVAENGSAGTDHGQAGCQFVLGPGVAGGQIVGGYDLAALDRGDLPTVVDTRSVYAAALDWLGGPTDDVLDGAHDRLDLLTASA